MLARSLTHSLFDSCCGSSRLRHLSEKGALSDLSCSDWSSWREDFLRLTRTWGPRGPLIHAGLPCESARLVMQGWTFAGDAARRKSKSGQGRHPFTGLPATGEQLPTGCYSRRGALLVASHRECERVGRVKRDKRHLTVRDCRCSCAQKSVWGRLWRGSPV